MAGTINVRSCSSYLRTTEGLYGVPVLVRTAPLTMPRASDRAASATVATRRGGGGAGAGSTPRSTIPSSASARQASAERSRELTYRNRYPDLALAVWPIQRRNRLADWEVMLEITIPLQSQWPVAGVTSVVPGDTYNFTAWFRDIGAVSNFTNAVSITFQ